MPIVKKCLICNSEFFTKSYFIKHGGGKYCSVNCHHLSLKNGKKVNCFVCGKEVYKQLKALDNSKSGNYFCSKSCQTVWRNTTFIGPKHANWKNGMYSYKSVLTRHKVPAVCKLCRIKDRRVLAVHHIDKNRKNNKVENLSWLCHNCHHLVHRYKDEMSRFMVSMV